MPLQPAQPRRGSTPHASRSSTSASGSGSAGCVPIRPVGTGRTGVETDSASAAQFTHEAWRAATGLRQVELAVLDAADAALSGAIKTTKGKTATSGHGAVALR